MPTLGRLRQDNYYRLGASLHFNGVRLCIKQQQKQSNQKRRPGVWRNGSTVKIQAALPGALSVMPSTHMEAHDCLTPTPGDLMLASGL